MSESNYGVQVYQINVGQGDSAIYIQYERDPMKILSAVLIDGGYAKGCTYIEETILQIKTDFNCIDFRFDTIVVTHWDMDHINGVIKLIGNHLQMGDEPCSLMKYHPVSHAPQTVMYFPYWEKSKSGIKSLKSVEKYRKPAYSGGLEWGKNPTNSGVLQWTKDGHTYENVNKVRHTPETMLGVDFFLNNESPVADNYESITSLESLLDIEDIPDKNKPGLLCISTDHIKLGPAYKKKKKNFGDGVDSDSGSEEQVDSFMTKLATTADNKVSIVTLVVWRKSQEIAYYAAGDLDDFSEEQLVEWTQTEKKFNVGVVKASHHGAAGSFPHNMIEAWEPQGIIFSCGHNTGLRHPAWEIIYWISQEVCYTNKFKKPIWSTMYPYWLVGVTRGIPGIAFSEGPKDPWFNLQSLKDKKYTDGLKKLYEKQNNPPPPAMAVERLLETPLPSPSSFRTKRFFKVLHDQWERLSYTSIPAPGNTDKNGKFVTANDQVLYILTRSRFTLSKRGWVITTKVAEYRQDGHVTPHPTITQTRWEDPVKEISSKRPFQITGNNSYMAVPEDSVDKHHKKNSYIATPQKKHHNELQTDIPGGMGQSTETGRYSCLDALPLRTMNQGYRIYAKHIDGESVDHIVVTEEAQRMFIEELHREVLELEGRPSGDEVAFRKDDEVFMWFKNSLSATKLVARGTDGEVDHFDMVLPFNESTPLKFSTEAVSMQFKVETFAPGPFYNKWGLLSDFSVMIFGLDRGQDFEVPISAVYAFAKWTTQPLLDTNVKLMHPQPELSDTLYSRNAIWFIPGNNYFTAMRLNFRFSHLEKLQEFLQVFLGETLVITDASVTVRKECRHNLLAQSRWNASIVSEVVIDCTAKISNVGVKVTSVLRDNAQDMELLIDFFGADLDNILCWLKELLKITFDLPELPKSLRGLPSLRRIALRFKSDTNGPKCTSAAVTFQQLFTFGAENTEDVVFFLTYAWPQNELTGTLYSGVLNKYPFKFLYPEYEPYRRLKPDVPNEDNLAIGLHLAHIIPGDKISVPEHVLPTITSANVTIGSDRIYIAGQLAWNEDGGFALPIMKLDSIDVSFEHNWKERKTELYLDVRMQLVPRKLNLPHADLFGSINYSSESKQWSFEFGLDDLHMSTLYSFFDEDVKEGVMDMLESVVIEELRMKYDYSSSGKSRFFKLDGIVLLGPLKATCVYTYNVKNVDETEWKFNITVDSKSGDATIGDIMRSLVGQSDFLPSCVDTIKIATEEESFTVNIYKTKEYLVFNGSFNLGELGFSFVQLRKIGKEKSIPTKRVLNVGVKKLPDVQVPLVGKLPQVFDEMAFLWVDDTAPNGKGLTREEVEILNSMEGVKIRFKESNPQESSQQSDDVVLQKGLHFLIALNQMGVSKVVLDHRFGETKKSPESPSSPRSNLSGKKRAVSGETSMAPMEKKIGPLSISNIGLQFVNDTLYIILDATFELGPMKMSMLGFGLGVKFGGGFNLQNLPKSIELRLDGLSVGFDRPPLTLAGLFRSTGNMYQGGIAVGFVPYSFLAAGFYEDLSQYKTVFVFAKLTGPLITIGFAEISGICGGLGYNNTIGYPTVSEVPTYPFIDSTNLGSNPVTALSELYKSGWVQPKEDVNWLMVGLSVKAFGLLDVDAVVAVELNPYVKLGIFALARAGYPAKAKDDKRFLYVSLGISAVVDFQMGTMKVEGQLTPDSFILSPSCHLTGGFGLFYWFGPNEHAGDWVFTIGGYHPLFARPAHYPNPPPLGISWKVGSTLSIIGTSYFAITPQCCMAGSHLRATLTLGPLAAWFDAQTNLLMNFDPFYFKGEVRATIGVSITLWLFICTLRIKAEVSATVYIHGPPFGGSVHVNFWVCGFNINFGPKAEEPIAVDLEKFWQMCLQDGVSSPRGVTKPHDHVLAVTSGLLPTSSSDSQIWSVRGGVFSFTIQSRFAIKEAKVTGGGDVEDKTPFYSKPMQLTSPIHSSTMTITISKKLTSDIRVDKWLLTPVVTNVPDALWGLYDASQDPTKSGNQIHILLNPGTTKTKLTMGITVSSPKSVTSRDKVPKFNFVHAMAVDVNSNNSTKPPSFPKYDDDIGKDSKPVPPLEGVAQWIKVKEAWGSDVAKKTSQSVLDTWRIAYMWEETNIKALPPKRAVDEFLTVYMAAPLMCA